MTKQRPILISRPRIGGHAGALGKAHYSYAFAADKFVDMFANRHVPVRTIDAPEQFKSPAYAELAGLDGGEHLHLIFRSTEDIRTIPGAYNVACFAWEFEALKQEGLPEESILKDQVRMLKSCQEVWTPCTYTKTVLADHGIDNAHVIPAPIATPEGRRGDAATNFADLAARESVPLVSRSSGVEEVYEKLARRHAAPLGQNAKLRRAIETRQLFLTICNPYDKRKNLATMIEGFLLATEGNDDAVLLIKLVTSGQFEMPSGYLFHQLRVIFGNPHCLHEDRIVLFSGFLSDAEMSALYRSADFYVCTSIAEGQNLPLLEAMVHGCVPVTVRNTAMADYVTSDNAVIIEDRRFSGLQSGLAGHVAQTRLTIDFADRYAVADAIDRSMALTADQRATKADAAAQTVRQLFSPRQVFKRLTERLEAVRSNLVPKAAEPMWLRLLGRKLG